jgi:alpha-L-fucosidase
MKNKITVEERERVRRMRWWHAARFGMFIHWGLYAQIGRGEWIVHIEQIPDAEYGKLADSWQPKSGAAREWAALAKKAGMKYMVMTTKHHDGFCLWDTDMTDYNAVRRGPGRDLVREYVEACREFGLKVGLYYSLMDWHHPDGARCAREKKARRRFLDFTQGCVRELMTNYGPVDILWYDVPCPLTTAAAWESRKMNAMARKLQPQIIINNRSRLPEDFGTPEGHVTPEKGRAWESCMTMNNSWGYMPIAPQEDWVTPRQIIEMIRMATAGGGNLLLNVGPAPDGSVPGEATESLGKVGKWLAANNSEAVYGAVDRIQGHLCGSNIGDWTLKGNTAYFWCKRWPGSQITIAGIRARLKTVTLLVGGKAVQFDQKGTRIILRGLPKHLPDFIAGVTVFKMVFASRPTRQNQTLAGGYYPV